MLKILPLTAVLSITLSVLVTGCEPSEAPQVSPTTPNSKPLVNPNQSPALSPNQPDPTTQQKIQQYLNKLAAKGFAKENHGVWMQSDSKLLANYQGTIPLPAASLTKVATSLAALQTLGPEYQFETLIGATGSIENGVLKGDLVVQGGENPFFVWEDAIVIANALSQKGIKRVAGNLIIVGKFFMNYETDSIKSGNFLKQALNKQLWPPEAEMQYQNLPLDTPRPQITISGALKVTAANPSRLQPLLRHGSLPLVDLLKK